MHQRRKIRANVVDRLENGIPILGTDPIQKMALDVGGRVFPQRTEAVWPEEYPAAAVYFVNEPVREVNAARDIIRRTLELNVDLLHLLRDDIEDELDRLAWQTEIILLSDTTLGDDWVNWIELRNTIPYEESTDGEQTRGVCRLTFGIDYWTEAYMPGTLNEFLSFGKEAVGQVGDGAKIEFDQAIRSA